jgi:hypothetical protein
MNARALALTLCLPALLACSDAPPRPVATPAPRAAQDDVLAPLSSRSGALPAPPVATPQPVDRPDPAEPGISDLARLARYIFREMGAPAGGCALDNPLHDPLSFTLRVAVKGGRMTSVTLAAAHVERNGAVQPLPPAQWPRELPAYDACLEPGLRALRLEPAPADDTYDADYSFPGHAPR